MKRAGTLRHFVTLAVVVTLVSGCEPLSLTALGIGGSAAVNHKMSSTPTRTFTAPILRVKTASIGALKRMGIATEEVRKVDNGELITARVGRREIQVELESLTANTTRMRVLARDGSLFYDGATASEIIVQTEKVLGV
ncbi:MAG TPA: hypothetical protein VJT77_06420 [Burkholderiales bacterium]|nr:hypothetical protein [Burkholderiales bacterium]